MIVVGTLIKHFEAGYGFFQLDDGDRSPVFVHNQELRKAGVPIPPPLGSRWLFEIVANPKGLRAVNLIPAP